MKITRLRLRELTGTFETESEFWEERLQRPIDVYPEHRAEGFSEGTPIPLGENRYRLQCIFLEIETDEGITGLAGPVARDVAFKIDHLFAHLLIGEDPTANERLWDKMYRYAVHGRKGAAMMAISAIDCGLWDLKGKWLGQPVHRLLGGPVRDSIPAYASALGYSLEPEKVHAQARQFIDEGFTATKWFPRGAPTDGRDGIRRNIELASTLRDAIGPDNDFMLDAWMSWDVPYTVMMSEMLEEFRPRWLEEPVMPDMIAAHGEIRRRSRLPIASGEHEYTRWGIKQLLDAGAVDVLQPDTYWAGGITEMVKIAAVASCYGIPVIPHGHSVPANIQLSAALPIPSVPLVEFLVKWNELHQYFWKEPVQPINGMVNVPTVPGMGVELDMGKVEEERDVDWSR